MDSRGKRCTRKDLIAMNLIALCIVRACHSQAGQPRFYGGLVVAYRSKDMSGNLTDFIKGQVQEHPVLR